MELNETPIELISPPEKRLVETMMTQKPRSSSFQFTFLFLLFVITFSQAYWMNFLGFASFLPAIKSEIFSQGQWWRIFTATFIHADFGHLVSNLYMLSIFSFFVYGSFGFIVHPLSTVLGAGLVNALSIYTYHPNVRLLGASGLVYLLGGFWVTLYLFIQRQHSSTQRIMRASGMALMVFFPSSFEPTTSYRTHFIGFTIGAIMALFYFVLNKKKIRNQEVYKIFGDTNIDSANSLP